MSQKRLIYTLYLLFKVFKRFSSVKPLVLETVFFKLFLAKEANIFKIIVQNCVSKCDFSRSGKPESQNFPGEHALGPP